MPSWGALEHLSGSSEKTFEHCLRNRVSHMPSRNGADPGLRRRFDRRHDARRGGTLAEMVEHHRARPDGGDRVGDTEICDVGR